MKHDLLTVLAARALPALASAQPAEPAPAPTPRAVEARADQELKRMGEFLAKLPRFALEAEETFDEIRRKYQADAEFHRAVDRYCEDFERLLDDVGRNDRDNIMTQTYLTSDTGKVYTMLAHASGRLN